MATPTKYQRDGRDWLCLFETATHLLSNVQRFQDEIADTVTESTKHLPHAGARMYCERPNNNTILYLVFF